MRGRLTVVIAGLHARAQRNAGVGLVAGHLHRAFKQHHPYLVFILPDVELGACDPHLPLASSHNKRVPAVMGNVEKSLALFQGDPALVLVVAEHQLGAQVQLDLAAIAERHLALHMAGFDTFIGIGHPTRFPAGEGGKRQSAEADGGSHRVSAQATTRRGRQHNRRRFMARQVIGDIPDFQHGRVFKGVQWMSIVPLHKSLTLGRRAITGMQSHAPMRGGVGDGVIFGF